MQPRPAASLRGFLCAGRWLGRGCRLRAGCRAGTMNFDVRDLDGTEWTFTVRGHACDLFNQLDGGIITLAEDGVSAIQAGVGNFGDKELRAVGVRSGVGVGETPRAVE